jgi:dihydroneopterin aldolase
MSGIYTITLQNCAFFARHGVHDEEEFLGQRFFVDAELDVVAGNALEQDSIDDTVNYGIAFTAEISTDSPRQDHCAQAECARSGRSGLCSGEH